MSGTARSSAPARSRASTLSENISVQTRSPRRPTSPCMVASGTAPMPAWSVAPSGTRSATRRPIVAESSSTVPTGAWGIGPSASTSTSTWSRSSKASPNVHGISPLVCAMTTPPFRRAASTAAGSTLTSTPSDTFPSRGGVVWSTTASGGSRVPKRVGTIDSREGT